MASTWDKYVFGRFGCKRSKLSLAEKPLKLAETVRTTRVGWPLDLDEAGVGSGSVP